MPRTYAVVIAGLSLATLTGCWISAGPPPEPANLPPVRPAETYAAPAAEPSTTKWLFGKPVGEWAMSETSADALRRIGGPAVRSLLSLLSDPDDQIRLQAVQILAGIGPEAEEAVPALRITLRDPNPLIRKWAARALGQIGPAAGPAVPELIEALRTDKT